MTGRTDLTWDLDVIFPGGSTSPAFRAFLEALAADVERATQTLNQLGRDSDVADWAAWLNQAQDIAARQRQAGAFVTCLTAADTADAEAKLLQGRISQISAELTAMFTALDAKLAEIDAAAWEQWVAHPYLSQIRFSLEERRRRTADRLPVSEEKLIASLAVDGYHAWGQLYDVISGKMRLAYERDGHTYEVSMGQAANLLNDPDRAVRQEVFAKWEQTWSEQAELCAHALNRLAGYRLAVYRHRGWSSVLHEPLELNRMEAATLWAMWNVIERHKQPFVRYLESKARILGVSGLSWHDVSAPIGSTRSAWTYDEARGFVVDSFRQFSPHMAEFADACFKARWIEAEDRPGKRAGAFCTNFPTSRQSRVFLTFSGVASNVATLAHELGHAYHQHVMVDLPQFAQNYAMNVAETASTFAEAVVTDAAIRQADSAEARLALLDDKVERSVAMFMNIHARFLFEQRFYEARKSGLVSVPDLNRLMLEAQREAYAGALAEYHPHFWASKLHFYLTNVPFYNFPYTFGYLFSTGLYAIASAEGPAFAERYVALLRDTGSMRVEDLAAKHLGVDLRQSDFWESAMRRAIRDVDEFLALADALYPQHA